MLYKSIRVSTRDHRLEHKNYKVRIILTQKSFGIFVVWRTHTAQCLLSIVLRFHWLHPLRWKEITKLSLQNPFTIAGETRLKWNTAGASRKLSSSLSLSTDWSSCMIGGKFAHCQFSFRFAYPNDGLVTIHSEHLLFCYLGSWRGLFKNLISW